MGLTSPITFSRNNFSFVTKDCKFPFFFISGCTNIKLRFLIYLTANQGHADFFGGTKEIEVVEFSFKWWIHSLRFICCEKNVVFRSIRRAVFVFLLLPIHDFERKKLFNKNNFSPNFLKNYFWKKIKNVEPVLSFWVHFRNLLDIIVENMRKKSNDEGTKFRNFDIWILNH